MKISLMIMRLYIRTSTATMQIGYVRCFFIFYLFIYFLNKLILLFIHLKYVFTILKYIYIFLNTFKNNYIFKKRYYLH